GLGLVIARTLAPVVPMRIFGAREALPRGGGPLRLVPITIVIGEPILFSAADLETPGKSLYAGLSDRVMKAISALRLERCAPAHLRLRCSLGYWVVSLAEEKANKSQSPRPPTPARL